MNNTMNNEQYGRCNRAGQPAITSFIPPSVDSIILDYQSPSAQPGFYPNEDPNSGGVGERPESSELTPSRAPSCSSLLQCGVYVDVTWPEYLGGILGSFGALGRQYD